MSSETTNGMTEQERQGGTSEGLGGNEMVSKRNDDEMISDIGDSDSRDQNDVDELLAKAKQEAGEWQDKFMRLAAEMENTKRRQERERQEWVKFSNEGIIKEMLPVLDGLDKAVEGADKQNSDEVKVFLQGVQILQKQLLDVLEKKGVRAVASVGQPFDPNIHQAIQRIEDGEVETETIAMEFAKGYTLNERLIRPAIVSVKVPTVKGS